MLQRSSAKWWRLCPCWGAAVAATSGQLADEAPLRDPVPHVPAILRELVSMSMNPPDRLRALLDKHGLVVMPAVWDGLSAKLSAAAGFETAFLSGSCVAASRLGG